MDGWQRLIDAADAPTRALRNAMADPQRAQTALLRRILAANADTAFGRRHGFRAITTIEDFRAAVPIADYEAFRSDIGRTAAGEPDLLFADPVVAFEETGGTAAGGKLIPYTAAGLAAFRAAALPWLADLARRRPGATAGSTYVSISPATRQVRRTAGGIAVGLDTDAAYLGADLAEAFASILAVPPAVAAIPDVDEWRLTTLVHLLEREDLSFVSVWSPTFFLDLVEALRPTAHRVSSRLSAPARRRLDRALGPAAIDTAILWPRLDTISCWADGSSAIFARRLAAACPQAHIEPKGLLATEAAITLPWGGAGPRTLSPHQEPSRQSQSVQGEPAGSRRSGAVPALTSTFIEFVDNGGIARLAHQLQVGDSYEVVITTVAGLYRYAIGDRVRCVGHDSGAPRLVFEGRASLVSDLVGEKLDEAFVAGVLGHLDTAAVLVPRMRPQPHYELWLDGTVVGAAAVALVEERLRANPQYAYARDIGQLAPLRGLSKPGFAAQRRHDATVAGRRMGDLKHSSLLLQRSATDSRTSE